MKISVAMCTYNGEKFLREQIDSILIQSHKVNEIIVCDDISSDKTVTILEEYKNKHPELFIIYKNETNLRSVKNFEKAISLCSGDIIFLADQDDKWLEDKVKSYLNYFEKNPQIAVIASNGFCFNEESKIIEKYSLWDVPSFLKEKNIAFEYNSLLTQVANIATGASMAIKKSYIDNVLPFPCFHNFHHDEWIAVVASSKNEFELLSEKYFYYRIHNNQQVGGVFFEKNKKTKKRLTDLFDLYKSKPRFKTYNKRLRKIRCNILLFHNIKDLNPNLFTFLKEKTIHLEAVFFQLQQERKKNYPVKSFFFTIFSRKP